MEGLHSSEFVPPGCEGEPKCRVFKFLEPAVGCAEEVRRDRRVGKDQDHITSLDELEFDLGVEEW